ncbi:MAG: SH3 domain-containing protein [Acidobacteria bacterium]|nr:SH3 domain-containing protein [Acidobacteriota bacterium]
MHMFLAFFFAAQAGQLAPVSEEKREPGFSAFVSRLKAAVAKRDSKALKKLTDEDVIAGGFGDKDEKGWTKFSNLWEVDQKDGAVWDVLADLLELGFFREAPSIYVSPYVAWKFPRDLDAADYLVVLRDALPLRQTPDRNGAVVANLAFDIVRRVEARRSSGSFDWVQVETAKGVRGYVQTSVVRSPLMARGQFALKDGKWRLSVLDRARD